ncbi:conserved domain protein [Actinomyces sp. oral taxon 170 str. F0386]|nr:conserved domain protein [Actinomyces sp. oral taxon 170 str. F0386]
MRAARAIWLRWPQGMRTSPTRTMSAAEVVAAGAGVSQARVARQARRA